MSDKINVKYSNESNQIISTTEDIGLKLKLADYYKGALVNQVEILPNWVVKFYVKKLDTQFEDFISLKDSIYGEEEHEVFELEYQGNNIFSNTSNRCTIEIYNQQLVNIESIKSS